MTDFDRYFAQAQGESADALNEARRRRNEAGSELDWKREVMLPQITAAGRQAVAKLRQAGVPAASGGWSMPNAGLVMSGRPVGAYHRDRSAGRFFKKWKAHYPASRIGTLTPSGTLVANHGTSGQDRGEVVYADARIEAVDAFAAQRISGEYGLSDHLVIDRTTQGLYVCFGRDNELPTVVPFVEYCARATLALVQAWANRER